MKPSIDTPSRKATRQECDMAEIMVGLVLAGDLVRALVCRDELLAVSARRSVLAAREYEAYGARRTRNVERTADTGHVVARATGYG